MTRAAPAGAVVAALATAFVLAACGGGGGGEDEPGPAAGVTGAAAPTFAVVHKWRLRSAGADAYDAQTTFELGAFNLLASVPLLPGFASFRDLTERCLVDGETDALAPVAVSMTNGMARPATLSARIVHGSATYGSSPATELLLATVGGDRAACGPLGDDRYRADSPRTIWNPRWADVSPGAGTGRAYGYLIVRDFFVADSATGMTPEVRLSRAFVNVEDGNPDSWFTVVEGPRLDRPLRLRNPTMDHVSLPLSGAVRPCAFGNMVVRCRN